MRQNEQQYIELLKNILDNGNERQDRTNTGTKSIFGYHFKFDISQSIPLLTTKKMAWKTIIKELLWFLSGNTDSKNLEKQNVNIWKQNTSKEFLNSLNLPYEEGDVGPLYPFSFRHYNTPYYGCSHNYEGKGFDQWTHLIHNLKNDPYSRRHIITTFNPSIVKDCVLPPCHGIAIQFYVQDISQEKKALKCHVYCRSSDAFLGLPFNIASYSILVYIVAKICNMVPLELQMSLGDAHIYNNHIDQVKQQINREIYDEPILSISNRLTQIHDIRLANINDFDILKYQYHPTITAQMAI